jgi:hypothetical protein
MNTFGWFIWIYEGESVNRPQMHIKRKTCDIRIRKKHLFLDISSTNNEYTCPIALPVRRNPQHRNLFDCCLSHFRTSDSMSSSLAERLPPSCELLSATLLTANRNHFYMNILCTESFCPQKDSALRQYSPKTRSPFWLLKPASEHSHARVTLTFTLWGKIILNTKKGLGLPRSWTVLLPTDTDIKPVTSITALLFPFVTYLLTLPRRYLIVRVTWIHISIYNNVNISLTFRVLNISLTFRVLEFNVLTF